ncbi:unnamed protein product [Phytophthora lilii]|uniref:Unnamed protein product n=1 Tax=Phytophthora lilii TaxID=2077276 RepID=A0A9W6XE27_9STRA|nr:unnamed protein product [Phytophthora lilii]
MMIYVDFVLRHRCPALASIEGISRQISNFFAPPPNLLLSEVCKAGTVEMLDWIWSASCTRAESRKPGWTITNFLRFDPHYYQWQFSQCLAESVRRGDPEIVNWLFAHFSGCEATADVVELAADGGHLHILRILWEHRSGICSGSNPGGANKELHTDAAFSRNTCCVKFNDTRSAEHWGEDVIRKSIDNGEFIECLQDDLPLGYLDRQSAIKYALRIGNLCLAEMLLPAGGCILDYGALCPHPEVIKRMIECGYQCWTEARAAAAMVDLAKAGNVKLMKELIQQYSPLQKCHASWTKAWKDAIYSACEYGNLSELLWLLGHPLYSNIDQSHESNVGSWRGLLDAAAERGHVDVMQCLYDQGLVTELSGWTITATIRNGQLGSMIWLVDRNFISGKESFDAAIESAALHGQLNILQFLMTMNVTKGYCKQSDQSNARLDGHYDIFYLAAVGGHLPVLKWLQRSYPARCEEGTIDCTAREGHFEALKWLDATRTEKCRIDTMIMASERGHFAIVKWLYEKHPESRTPEAIVGAITFGHLRIAHWLFKKYPRYVVTTVKPYEKWVNDNIVSGYPFESLLYTSEIYPMVFTKEFVKVLRGKYSPGNTNTPDKSRIMWSWIRDNCR